VGQSYKSKARDSTTDLTSNSRIDSIDKTDRKLGLLNNISDFTNNISEFMGPANKSTGCAKPTDVWKRYMSNSMLATSNSQRTP
jgi:hypothetical protein